jgi:hypothetical protein
MSSSSADSESGGEEATINGDFQETRQNGLGTESEDGGSGAEGGRISELLREEQEGPSTPLPIINGPNRYRVNRDLENSSEDGSLDAIPRGVQSPIESVMSIPDDSPSVQVRNTTRQIFIMLTQPSGIHFVVSWWE